jgi:hypothetical protein
MKIKIDDDALISYRGVIELEKLNGFSQKDFSFATAQLTLCLLIFIQQLFLSLELLREIN